MCELYTWRARCDHRIQFPHQPASQSVGMGTAGRHRRRSPDARSRLLCVLPVQYNDTPLHKAVANRHHGAAKVLLVSGADSKSRNLVREAPGRQLLWPPAASPSLAMWPPKPGAHIACTGVRGVPLFHRHRAMCQSCPLLNAPSPRKNQYGWSALHYASMNGDMEMAQLLLTWAADVNATDQARHDSTFQTPLPTPPRPLFLTPVLDLAHSHSGGRHEPPRRRIQWPPGGDGAAHFVVRRRESAAAVRHHAAAPGGHARIAGDVQAAYGQRSGPQGIRQGAPHGTSPHQ